MTTKRLQKQTDETLGIDMKDFILGDCMEGMAKTPDKFYDLAIVDPPYGIGMDNSNKRTKPSRPNSYKHYPDFRYHKTDWDSNRPDKEYFSELFRVSKHQIIWGANYLCEYLPSSKGWIFWNKKNGLDNCFSDGEFAFSSKGVQSKYFECSPFDNLNGGKDRIHPTQKPVQLYKWLLRNYGYFGICDMCLDGEVYRNDDTKTIRLCPYCNGTKKKKATILSTHVGSASDLIAFEDFGCDYMGYEIDKDYYESALKRLNQHKAQLTIFND